MRVFDYALSESEKKIGGTGGWRHENHWWVKSFSKNFKKKPKVIKAYFFQIVAYLKLFKNIRLVS